MQSERVTQPEAQQTSDRLGVRGIVERATKADFRKGLLTELGEVFESDKSEERLSYNTQKAEVAKALGVTQMDVHRAVMELRV